MKFIKIVCKVFLQKKTLKKFMQRKVDDRSGAEAATFFSFGRRKFLLSTLKVCFAGALLLQKSGFAAIKKKLLDEDFFAEKENEVAGKKQPAIVKNIQRWQAAFEGGEREIFDGGILTMLGKLPKGINGYIFKNGGAGFASRIRRASHTYEQEPLLQAIRVKNGSLGHYGRTVVTNQYKQEVQAGKNLFSRYASLLPQKNASKNAPYYQPMNMSVLPIGEVLYILGDNTKPLPVDKTTLTLSEGSLLSEKQTGKDKNESKEVMEDFRFSSHPIQTSRGIWNAVPVWPEASASYESKKEGIMLSRFTLAGSMAAKAFHSVKNVGYFHSFLITDTRVVVVMPPYYKVNNASKPYGERFVWRAEDETRIFVFKIDTLELLSSFSTSAFYCEHFSNAYDDKNGEVVFDGFAYENPSIVNNMHLFRAKGVWQPGGAKHRLFRLNLKSGLVTQKVLHKKNFYEMPSIDPRLRGKRHRMVVALKRSPKDAIFQGKKYFRKLVVLSPTSNTEVGYRFFNSSEIIEEHVYVPDYSRKPGTGGWIVGTCFDLKLKKTILNIFEKDSISSGPKVRAFFPYGVPVGMHGTFDGDYS